MRSADKAADDQNIQILHALKRSNLNVNTKHLFSMKIQIKSNNF